MRWRGRPASGPTSLRRGAGVMRPLVIAAALAIALAAAPPATAGPIDTPGFTSAFSCSACHGRAGASRADAVPILAGMPAWYLKKAIDDYAAGRRPSPAVEPFSKIGKTPGADEVAGYFAPQPREGAQSKLAGAAIVNRRLASR